MVNRAEVEVFPELKEVVVKLVNKYGTALEGIDPDRIVPLKTSAKSKRNVVKVTAIKVPHPSITNLKFAITAYSSFDELDESRQIIHVLRELCRIEDFEKGKIGDYPLKDFPFIIEEHGTLWQENEELPNILRESSAAVEK